MFSSLLGFRDILFGTQSGLGVACIMFKYIVKSYGLKDAPRKAYEHLKL